MVFQLVEKLEGSAINNHTNSKSTIIKTDHFMGIIDASGPKQRHRLTQDLSREVMQEILIDSIASASNVETPLDLMNRMNQRIILYYNKHNIYTTVLTHPELRLSANVLLINRKSQQLWVFGQGYYLLDDEKFQIKAPISNMVRLLREQIAQNYTLVSNNVEVNQKIEADMNPFLASVSQFQNNMDLNSSLSFGIVDGFDIPEKFIHSIDLSQVNELVLATKGYPAVYNSLNETENTLLASLKNSDINPDLQVKMRPDLAGRCYLKCQRT